MSDLGNKRKRPEIKNKKKQYEKQDEIDDKKAHKVARDIKTNIENELQYPGTIKVTVIRETRAVEEAK